jgi:hypothetical protein
VFFARACPEPAEGVGDDALDPIFVRSELPVMYAVVVPALRKIREEPALSEVEGTGHPQLGWLLQFEGRATRHARFLKFHHPITGEPINLEAALPSGFSLQQ